jgi:hypothetical protein
MIEQRLQRLNNQAEILKSNPGNRSREAQRVGQALPVWAVWAATPDTVACTSRVFLTHSRVHGQSASMDYNYDVFVSYKRSEEWNDWVSHKFIPMLRRHLDLRLADTPRIFCDDQIHAGTDWPDELAHALASSRVLIPLFSRGYFSSSWCLHELYAMRHKEKRSNLRTPMRRSGIIVPARIHDGTSEDLPAGLQDNCRNETVDLTRFMLHTLDRGLGDLYQDFEIKIGNWVETSVLPAIHLAPKLEQEWYDEIREKKFECPLPPRVKAAIPSLA